MFTAEFKELDSKWASAGADGNLNFRKRRRNQ